MRSHYLRTLGYVTFDELNDSKRLEGREKMKILYLARFLPDEGSTTHMYTLAEGFIDRGHEVHMISGGPTDHQGAIGIFNEISQYGLHHHKVRFPLNTMYGFWGQVSQMLLYTFVIPKVIFMMWKIKPDVIHVHYPVTSYLAKIYGKITGRKFLTTHHISGIPKHPLHKKADAVIAISRELETELLNHFQYSPGQINLIFNGVSREKFNKSIEEWNKKELGIPGENVIIGYVGSYSHRKGLDILMDAFANVEGKAHLVLLGDGDTEWVNKLIESHGLIDKVTLYPFQDPVKFYAAFDVLVLPSRKEGFPLVPLEAMMMGVPTVRSNVEGAKDQIEHQVDGYIFENENAEDLSVYLNLLVNDADLRVAIGRKARVKALEKFTEATMLDELLKVYEEIS